MVVASSGQLDCQFSSPSRAKRSVVMRADVQDPETKLSSMVKPLLDAPCCLLHTFLRVATLHPHKIAIVHAPSHIPSSTSPHIQTPVGIDRARAEKIGDSLHHDTEPILPVYPGDVVYTYQELQGAVESLAAHLAQEFSEWNASKGGHIEGEPVELSGLDFVQYSTQTPFQKTFPRNFENAQLSRERMDNATESSESTWDSKNHDGRKVGIWMVQSAEYLVAVLAVLKAGGVFIPLDPCWPAQRLQTVLETAKPCILLGCKNLTWAPQICTVEKISSLEATGCKILWLSETFMKDREPERGKKEHNWHCESTQKYPFCYVLYTSGSTGTPKGVCGTEEGLMNRLQWMEDVYPHHATDVGCFKTTVGFIDHLTEALGVLLSCTPLIIPSPEVLKGNSLALLEYIKAYRITRLTAVPSLMRALLPALQSRHGQAAINSLRLLVISGEPLSCQLWQDLQSVVSESTILNLYGSTEMNWTNKFSADWVWFSDSPWPGLQQLSGDCAHFDCSTLGDASTSGQQLLKQHGLSNIPIGMPIKCCYFFIVTENNKLASADQEGELWVGGVGVASGYLDDPEGTQKKFISEVEVEDNEGPLQVCSECRLLIGPQTALKAHECIALGLPKEASRKIGGRVFKTGDLARRLSDGSFILSGRKDRQVKIHGHRIAIEEIERMIELSPQVEGVTVTQFFRPNGDINLVAYIVPKHGPNCELPKNDKFPTQSIGEASGADLKIWLAKRLPDVMIPHVFIFLKSTPLTSSGKVDYDALPNPLKLPREDISTLLKSSEGRSRGVEFIQEVFARVLRTNTVSSTDDFFSIGGTSISAAHVAHILGVDMRILYTHPTALDLYNVIGDKSGIELPNPKSEHGGLEVTLVPLEHQTLVIDGSNKFDREDPGGELVHVPGILGNLEADDESLSNIIRPLKRKTSYEDLSTAVKKMKVPDCVWPFSSLEPTAFLRCNRTTNSRSSMELAQLPCRGTKRVPVGQGDWRLQQRWRVSLHSCVDASPLIVIRGDVCRLFIGSHSHNFISVDANCGEMQWETKLGGRVESTAAVTRDFTKVVVGCYDGFIYFLDFWTGQKIWSFETGGEVKCQPALDPWQGLVWCGSHDHHIYAIDATSQTCVWQYNCGGSIFGAPTFDQDRKTAYVAATSGIITAIKIEPSLRAVWTYACEAPIFGSLAVDHSSGLVISPMVSGSIIALTSVGSLAWQAKTEGPIFAGACISSALPSQVLVCSRDSHIYGLNLQEGSILWKHNVGDAITSSAYVDESLLLSQTEDTEHHYSQRLLCVASTSGILHVLRVYTSLHSEDISTLDSSKNFQSRKLEHGGKNGDKATLGTRLACQEIACMRLPGDVFSSPVMIGGNIFVGCRDDYVYAVNLFLNGKGVLDYGGELCTQTISR